MDHLQKGKEGENLARKFLEAEGYEVIEENYRSGRGEIDLIALKDNALMVFVEVKTRSGSSFGEPEDFVDEKKARLIVETAENYIYDINWYGEIRFDIISILLKKPPIIRHFEDSFY